MQSASMAKDMILEEELSLIPCCVEASQADRNVDETRGMRRSRRLEKGAIMLHMGNGNQAEVEATRSYFPSVHSGIELCLEQCHYTPYITRGVIFISRLRDAGFELAFMHYAIFVSKNNMFYINAFPRKDIFEIDMDGVVSIDKSMFHVAKRTKYDLNKTYLWHCRLGDVFFFVCR
ncbi:hypothetical protein Tco_1021932 [Tanacetum coccineum]